MTDKEYYPTIKDKKAARELKQWCDEAQRRAKEQFDAACAAAPNHFGIPPAAFAVAVYREMAGGTEFTEKEAMQHVTSFMRGFYLGQLMWQEELRNRGAQ